MSKRRKRAKAKKNLKKPSNVLVVLVEGQTEKNYIEHLKNVYNSKIKLKILNQSTLRKDFSSTLQQFSNNLGVDQEEIILIYDLENSKEEYETFIDGGKLKHPNTYLTQPCIELHFLLHYENFHWTRNNHYTQKIILKELKRIIPKYEKGKNFAWDKHVTKEQLELARIKSDESFNTFDDNSFSMLGKFVNEHLMNE